MRGFVDVDEDDDEGGDDEDEDGDAGWDPGASAIAHGAASMHRATNREPPRASRAVNELDAR